MDKMVLLPRYTFRRTAHPDETKPATMYPICISITMLSNLLCDFDGRWAELSDYEDSGRIVFVGPIVPLFESLL